MFNQPRAKEERTMATVHCYRCDQHFDVDDPFTKEEVQCPNCDNKGPIREAPVGSDDSRANFWLPEDPE